MLTMQLVVANFFLAAQWRSVENEGLDAVLVLVV